MQPLMGLSLAEEKPRLSSDGRRLAFASTHSGNRSEIFLADADGSNVSQLRVESKDHLSGPPTVSTSFSIPSPTTTTVMCG